MDNHENTQSLATELLHELKASARRWFIAFCIMVGLELATIIGFMWYISLPEESIDIENDSGNANYIGDHSEGVINNGKDSSSQESSAEETQQ